MLHLLCIAPAHAGMLDFGNSGAEDIQKMLSGTALVIEDYDMPHDELVAFYTPRNFKPAWNFTGVDNAAAFTAFLDSVDKIIEFHGLDRSDYPVDTMRTLAANPDDASKLKLEFLVTDSLLRLAHDLHGDSIDLGDLYAGWVFHRSEMDIPALLSAAVTANSLNDFMESLTPKNPAYASLAKNLKTYRDIAAMGGWPPIAPGPTLKLKDKGPRVQQLRTRLGIEGYLPAMSLPEEQGQLYDADLQKTVQTYQLRNGIDPDGNLGPKTFTTLNIPVTTRIGQILANMERWRHMPDDFPPDRYAMVNIASQELNIVKKGKSVYRGAVVVGRVDRKTPFIQSAIRSMIVNPSWHVPSKIAMKDILPKLRKDPHYLEKMGFVISGSEEDPHGENIDWATLPSREFNFRLRQSPGDMNSLGRLKFDFNNDFAVYMHGTPHQELFKKTERTFSSGCVRLRDPVQVAEVIMADNKDPWDAKKIEDEIAADKTRWVAISPNLPIFIVYWTVFTDEDGQLNFRPDAYAYDKFLMENMRPEAGAPPPILDKSAVKPAGP